MEDDDTLTEVTATELTSDQLARMGFGPRITTPKPPTKNPKPRTSISRGRPHLEPHVLRVPQLRILAALSDTEATNALTGLTLEDIEKQTKIGVPGIKKGLGHPDPNKREQHDNRTGYRSLLTRGLVIVVDSEGQYRYYLSLSGQSEVCDREEELEAIKKVKFGRGDIVRRTGPKIPKIGEKVRNKRPAKRIKKNIEIEQPTNTPTPESI